MNASYFLRNYLTANSVQCNKLCSGVVTSGSCARLMMLEGLVVSMGGLALYLRVLSRSSLPH